MRRSIRRRDFVALLGGAALASPLPARARQPGKLPTIGFLGATSPTTWSRWVPAFVARLRELNWIEGRTVAIDYRWADGQSDRSAEIAAEFVRRSVDVIVTGGGAVPAAKRATAVIPIVFAVANDPVGGGLVESLARPGGNVTGLSLQAQDIGGKRLELAREVLPALRRLAVMFNADSPAAVGEIVEVQGVARTIGVDLIKLEIRGQGDIESAFSSTKGRVDAIYVGSDALMRTHQPAILTRARSERLPTITGSREGTIEGALISYGPNVGDLFRRAAEYVDKILRGAKPADLPVEQPTKFELVINLTTAKALGLNIPEAFLLRADEVIE